MSELGPVLKQRFFNSNGVPLAGGFLYTYIAGTTTPLVTYTDQSGGTPNTNPIVLDANGQCDLWLGDNTYKFVLQDSLAASQWTIDNVQSVASRISASTKIFQNVVISYSQLQIAALTNAIQLFSMPAKSILGRVIIKHSTAFAGTSISAVSAQVGPSGHFTDIISGLDVLQAVGDQVFDQSLSNYIGSFANATPIYLNAVAVGANLSALTQGSLTVYYEYQTFG